MTGYIYNLQVKEDEVNQLKQETQRLNKTRETIQRKLRQVEDNKSDLEFQRETLKGQILGLERGMCISTLYILAYKQIQALPVMIQVILVFFFTELQIRRHNSDKLGIISIFLLKNNIQWSLMWDSSNGITLYGFYEEKRKIVQNYLLIPPYLELCFSTSCKITGLACCIWKIVHKMHWYDQKCLLRVWSYSHMNKYNYKVNLLF